MLTALLLGLIPSAALAASGEDVALKFTSQDRIYLYISLGFGAIALVCGWILARMVLARSPGDDNMQAVGSAIRSGALAYLRQQVRTMSIFVILLAVGLFFLNQPTYGPTNAMLIAVCFIAGVLASYIAGYAGMLMAVNGNMRTANAALSSYKLSLETAFQSGAVAGLLTVGMGLVGATLIFMLGGNQAMRLLIGFGFGGSLAALFMRVGGGIYTKAADVGADLVGKVEAGIPEDDPRNPATIADNVGDNVGDCAGMAADIFESYEVTLVAAIVLGAATAAIFDGPTWMKLVLFALMARGVGILASIFGIFTVKGSNDLNKDPLASIHGGFWRSALLAVVLTIGLAYFMMGGAPGSKILANSFTDVQQFGRDEVRLIKATQEKIAKRMKIEPYAVTAEDIQKEPEIREAGLAKDESNAQDINASIIRQALTTELETLPPIRELKGYSKVDFKSTDDPVLNYTVMPPSLTGAPQPASIREAFDPSNSKNQLQIIRLRITQVVTPPPAQPGQPPPPKPKPMVRTLDYGPVTAGFADEQINRAKNPSMKIEILGRAPVSLYANKDGKLLAGIEGKVQYPQRLAGGQNLFYYKQGKDEIKKLNDQRMSSPDKALPPTLPMDVAIVTRTPVPWYLFALCIVFGIAMAFVIERLTDYYVSTHKRPVKEVADVATAGPAPMIIQGFAYAKESSVFTVFALVIALITPLYIFPPAWYGGYILSFYGIALVGLGLLTTTGFILAMDTFGPISDNAQGIFEMSGVGHTNPEASKGVQRLDAAGNTTKALTKGFAIATAVVAAVALFHTYIETARLTGIGLRIDLPEIFLGLMIGGAAPYLFSAFTINAVGRAAFQLIGEVRRQFRNDSGIMAGTSKPDYAKCVAIVTAAAQKELLGPGILAIALPGLVAFGFSIGKEPTNINGVLYNLTGAQALGGFLAGAILSGQLMAVLLANSGGMWDNAKKLIEDGLHGGKGTDAHKAAVVCDTVGDPFKDTAGPALNPLIKVMNLVALLLAGVVIQPFSDSVLITVSIACLVLLTIAFWWSKRGSLSTELVAMQAQTPEMASLPTAQRVGNLDAPAKSEPKTPKKPKE